MLELEHEFRVVDVHVRLEPDAARRKRDGFGSPERLEREMHQAGVVRSVVYPGTRDGAYLRNHDGYLKANNAVARMSVDRPFVALARLTGPRDPGDTTAARLRNFAAGRKDHHTTPADVEQYAYDDRFVGFKLHPARDGLPDAEVLAALEDAELPVLAHGGEGFPPDAIRETLLEYDLPVIVAHFGGHPLNRELMAECIDMLESHDSLYLDTSFVRYRDPMERAVMEHPDRVLFGSGSPSAHPNVAVMEILTLDVPEDAMRKVFSNNPGRVIEELAPSGE